MKSRIIHALLFGLIFSTVFTTISLFTPPVTKFKCDSQLFSSNLYFIGASKDYSDINIGKVNCGVYPYNEYIGFPMPTRIKENPPSGRSTKPALGVSANRYRYQPVCILDGWRNGFLNCQPCT